MQTREFVELAGSATEIAGVLLIVGGLLFLKRAMHSFFMSCRCRITERIKSC